MRFGASILVALLVATVISVSQNPPARAKSLPFADRLFAVTPNRVDVGNLTADSINWYWNKMTQNWSSRPSWADMDSLAMRRRLCTFSGV